MRTILYCCISFALFNSCTKVIVDQIGQKKMTGTWTIREIQVLYPNISASNLAFQKDTMSFNDNGDFQFINSNGVQYKGSWSLSNEAETGDCYTAPDGSTNCSTVWNRTVSVKASLPNGQDEKSAYFEYVEFPSGNTCTAKVRLNMIYPYKYILDKK